MYDEELAKERIEKLCDLTNAHVWRVMGSSMIDRDVYNLNLQCVICDTKRWRGFVTEEERNEILRRYCEWGGW